MHQRNVGRFLKKDREGVASTIGTMMALLIFLTLFTMFTNSYLPLWMKDNERQHMTTVMDQMGTLKGKIEIQENLVLISGQTSLPMYQTFQLGAAGVPVFVAPTVGILSLMPNNTNGIGMTVTFVDKTTGSITPIPGLTNKGGCLQLYAPNRYYVPQWISYENNGILTKQNDGQTMNVAPGISLNGALGTISVGINTVNILGANTTVTGYGNGGLVFSTLYIDSNTPTLPANNMVEIAITTFNGLAFWNYFNDTFHSMDQTFHRVSKTHYTSTSLDLEMPATSADVKTLTIKIMTAVSLSYDVANVRATLTS
jgi:hypothetical protein